MARKLKPALHAGVDVSAKTLTVAWRGLNDTVNQNEFPNDHAGHAALVRLLRAGKRPRRVVVEATGSYSVDVCLALHDAGVAVMVANPLATRRFAEAQLRRAKTDRVDALLLLDFAERMEFVPWERPAEAVTQLHDFARRIRSLGEQRTAELNRLHAAKSTSSMPAVIVMDLEESIAALTRRLEHMTLAAEQLATTDPELCAAMDIVMSVKGIARRSAVRILGELMTLAADMTPRQVVAHAGLDPRPVESGTSVHGARHISRVGNAALRAALYMPVLVAVEHEPSIKMAYEAMLARNKPKKVAQTAIARRLLQVLWRMIRTKTAFDGAKFGALPREHRASA